MSRRIAPALGGALLTVALAAGCGSGSHPASQGPTSAPPQETASTPPEPSSGQTCVTPGSNPGMVGLPACDTQAPELPPAPTASPAGFQRLTFTHQPGPVPQGPSVTLTRADGVPVALTLEFAGPAAGGAQATIGITAGGKASPVRKVADGDDFTDAGYTFHIVKIWVMSTPAGDAVDLIATPAG